MQNRLRVRAPDGSSAAARSSVASAARHLRGRGGGISVLDQESILELQRLAGNAAVAKSLIGSKRNGRTVMGVDAIKVDQKPSAPPDGLKSIRAKKKGAGLLGYTIRSIADWAPLLKPEAPTQEGKGWTTKARPINHVPEPEFEEYWPTTGKHKIADHTFIDVNGDWEKKLKGGEDEHVSDSTHAWQISWKKAAEIINGLSKKPGAAQPTQEDATKDLWNRYRNALPSEDMRPKGDQPTESAQREIFSPDHGTLFRWLFETTVVRDTRGYHEPKTKPEGVGDDTVSTIVPGDSKLPGPLSPELIKEVRVKWKPGKDIIGS